MLGWLMLSVIVGAAAFKGTGAAALITMVVLAIKAVEYMQWRARIDVVGGPEATLLGGTKKAIGDISSGDRLEIIEKIVAQNPKVYRLWTGPLFPIVHVVHPETIKPFLLSKSTVKPWIYKKIFDHLSDSIFVKNGTEWKHSRRQFSQSLPLARLTRAAALRTCVRQ
eukprot:m.20403 g.20403  ORF g.20403 m.20403 type:complete len:167 (+) comp10207_c0_seq1:68-568(+)